MLHHQQELSPWLLIVLLYADTLKLRQPSFFPPKTKQTKKYIHTWIIFFSFILHGSILFPAIWCGLKSIRHGEDVSDVSKMINLKT